MLRSKKMELFSFQHLAIPLCAMSVRNCFPSKEIFRAIDVAFAAAEANDDDKEAAINTRPPEKQKKN